MSAGINMTDAVDTVDHYLLPAEVREAREQQMAMANYSAGFGVKA